MPKTKAESKPKKAKKQPKAAKLGAVRGVVRNGVVVLANGVRLAEGQDVSIKPLKAKKNGKHVSLPDFSDLAVDTGIPDLATNLDHYLYGHPKVTDLPPE